MKRLLKAAIHLVLLMTVTSSVVAENTPQPLTKNLNLPPESINFDLSDLIDAEQKGKIKPSSLRVGVYYSDEFQNFKYQEVNLSSANYKIDLGKQSLNVFRDSTKLLFAEVKEIQPTALMRRGNVSLDNILFSSEEITNLDGVIIPTIWNYGFSPRYTTGLSFHSAAIEYRVALFDKGGTKVGEWLIGGYGKSEAERFSRKKGINRATDLAIGDAAVRLASEIMNKPEVRAWMKSMSKNTNPID